MQLVMHFYLVFNDAKMDVAKLLQTSGILSRRLNEDLNVTKDVPFFLIKMFLCILKMTGLAGICA